MWLFRRKASLGKSRYLTNNGQRPRVTTHPPIERTDHIKKCSLPNQQRETCDSFVNLSFSELACCVRSRKLDESLERFSIFCFSALHISLFCREGQPFAFFVGAVSVQNKIKWTPKNIFYSCNSFQRLLPWDLKYWFTKFRSWFFRFFLYVGLAVQNLWAFWEDM